MASTQHPESYYDAKRALLAEAGPADRRGSYELREAIPRVLDALGWAAEPVLDAKGKPVKVFAVEVRTLLPEALRTEWETSLWEAAKKANRQYSPSWTAYVAAPNKSAAIDALYGDDRSRWMRPKTGDVGEIAPTRLAYEAAVNAPAGSVAVARTEAFDHETTTYALVPLAALDRKD